MKNPKKFWLLFFYGTFVILLPWQTRWIFFDQKIQGEIWEYGRLSLYASMIVLAFVTLLFAYDKKLKPYFSKDKFLYAMFAYFFVVSIFSAMPHVSFYYLLLIYLAMLFAHISKYIPKIFSFKMLFISGLIQGLLAIFQFSTQKMGANKWLGMSGHLAQNPGDAVLEFSGIRILRAYGSLPHPNILGGFLFVAIFVGLYLWFNFYKERKMGSWKENIKPTKIFYFLFIIAGLVVLSFAILSSFSRSALLALILSLLILLIVSISKSNWLIVNIVGKYIIFFLFISLIFNAWAPGAWPSRIRGSDRLEIKPSEERVASWGQLYWEDKSNILFGQGLGMNSLEAHKNNIYKPIYSTQPIHNVFLLALAEIGILGIIFLLGLFVRFWSTFKKADIFTKLLFFGVLVISIFDHYFWTTWTGWLIVGFLAATLREESKK